MNWPPDYDKLDRDPDVIECDDCKGTGEEELFGMLGDCRTCEGKGKLINPDLTEHEQQCVRTKLGW